MTHDVIRDLLGLKLDMTNCAEQGGNKAQAAAKGVYWGEESMAKEIDRKQAKMVAAQVALEKVRQRDHLLTIENEMFKIENANQKKKIMELENELKQLSDEQSLQQQIHHHAKIKPRHHGRNIFWN